MIELTVRKVGNSLGVILSSEARKALGVSEGDRLFLTDSVDGVRVTPFDPTFSRQMAHAKKAFKSFKNSLRELSKR